MPLLVPGRSAFNAVDADRNRLVLGIIALAPKASPFTSSYCKAVFS